MFQFGVSITGTVNLQEGWGERCCFMLCNFGAVFCVVEITGCLGRCRFICIGVDICKK